MTITPTVSFDPASGLYTYDYSIASSATSVQNVSTFALRLISSGTAISPSGWSYFDYASETISTWSATEAAPRPPGWVDDGSIPPTARDVDRVTFTVK